ncbi:MAG: DUF1707 domain-containing protein [Intrasporangium sp.]|uniref:DUF1707 SHOCT-like domain-containing protein n=1 Tax=Intrasporangium sp. TaxID=1925024 RepID=UPI0026477BF5|nr:DUF1707 domain-containing protein [Intrasporangium sp.]MDN5794505.1 DUF1707 domain-containing protein [Intrasporangium sp.]
MTDQPDYRVGDDERQRAASLLQSHFKTGRLDADEYEDRRGKALDAVTRSDLDALFTDLPAAAEPPRSEVAHPSAVGRSQGRPSRRTRDTVMALLPFAALVLFFLTGQWMWFLIIPVGGIVLYGADGRKGRDQGQTDDRR